MKKTLLLLSAFLLIFVVCHSNASVVLERTRIIFPANKQSISLQLFNDSEQSTLIQSWIDEGDISSTPETTMAPFIVMPPINKIVAQGGMELKLRQLDNTLPNDRESIFYLNVLDIAPKPKSNSNNNTLQLALQTRIKLFYRPMQLDGNVNTVFQSIQITKNKQCLEITNPTGYFFNISKLYLNNNKDKPLLDILMIAPFSKKQIEYSSFSIDRESILTIVYIDDDGNYIQGSKTINL